MTPEEFKQICREFDAAPSEAGWTEGHPIFQMASDNDCMKARIAELEAELEGLKKQKPVAITDKHRTGGILFIQYGNGSQLPDGTGLYAQPVQPAVPEATQEMVDMVNGMEGWSGFELEDLQDICIAMLSAAPKEK